MTKVLFVFPRFNPNSFWSFRDACDIWGARCSAPPLGLITVAALLPQTWPMRLIDRNAEELTDEDIAWADVVMTGGMMPQRPDTYEVMRRVKALGKPVCIGGPDPTSSPECYEDADFLVLGEAEGILDTFVAAWQSGARSGRFSAEKFTADVSKSPVPRFDLLNFKNYLYVGLQFSRGCPFNCEFCDIIELYGRMPRAKTADQVLREFDRLYELGYRGHVDFVDDNLIGNKKALMQLLPIVRDWQKRHNFPFKFSTEASINLADDPELLQMMRSVKFFGVFIGIESPDPTTLVHTQKKQNTRRSLEDSIFKIYEAGIFVLAGFIVGFDTDVDGVGEAMIECIQDTSIPIAMVGLLTALPNTQLTRRLLRENRLYADFNIIPAQQGDQCTGGLNFKTLRPRRDVLKDYRTVIGTVYRPEVFFARVHRVIEVIGAPEMHVKPNLRVALRDLGVGLRLMWRVTTREPEVRPFFWRAFIAALRRNQNAVEFVCSMAALYLHMGRFAGHVVTELDRQIAEVESGTFDLNHVVEIAA